VWQFTLVSTFLRLRKELLLPFDHFAAILIFFFGGALEFEFKAYTLSHSTSPFS
jgi:hypothetical protein